MFALWAIVCLIVAIVSAFCALTGAFKKSPAFWVFVGAGIDAALYILMMGVPSIT